MGALTRFLLLCAAVLAFPALASAQPIPLTVQRVWTQDANGNNKTVFAPGETIQFVVQLNNSYGGTLLSAALTIITSFYNNTKTTDIPNGVSTSTWNAIAPSTQNAYSVAVKAYDSFYGRYAEGNANFTVTTNPAALSSGWYHNGTAILPGGSPIIYEDSSGLRLVWGKSYVYRYPGNDPLYWYVEVIYFNNGSKDIAVSCIGMTDPSLFKEYMRGTANSGSVAAEDTFCSHNTTFTTSIKPGESFYNWAIFHNVPWKGSEVSLEWGIYGSSPWLDPWYSSYPPAASPPSECPPELVTLKTCQPSEPPSQGLPTGFVCLGGRPGECNQSSALRSTLTKDQLFAILLSSMIDYVLAGDLAEQGRRLSLQAICASALIVSFIEKQPDPEIVDFCQYAQKTAAQPLPITPAQKAIQDRVKKILQEASQK